MVMVVHSFLGTVESKCGDPVGFILWLPAMHVDKNEMLLQIGSVWRHSLENSPTRAYLNSLGFKRLSW